MHHAHLRPRAILWYVILTSFFLLVALATANPLDAQTFSTISQGETLAGQINAAAPLNTYLLRAEQGDSIRISARATDRAFNLRITLLSRTLNQLALSEIGEAVQINHPITQTGVYFILVTGIDEGGGAYTLTLEMADDVPDTAQPPILREPAAGAELPFTGSVTFVWDPVPGAIQYRLERLACNPDYTDCDPLVPVSTDASAVTIDHGDPRRTLWRVRAIYPDGSEGPFSDWSDFTIDQRPILREPVAGAELPFTGSVTFVWDPVPGAVQYRLERLACNLDYTDCDPLVPVSTDASAVTIDHGDPRRTLWRVRAIYPDGTEGPFSDWRPFSFDRPTATPLAMPGGPLLTVTPTTEPIPTLPPQIAITLAPTITPTPTPLPPPVQLQPLDGTVLSTTWISFVPGTNDVYVDFAWEAVPGAVSYRFERHYRQAGINGWVPYLTALDVADTTIRTGNPYRQTRWRVYAVAPDGSLSQPSPWAEFTFGTPTATLTPLAMPGGPLLTATPTTEAIPTLPPQIAITLAPTSTPTPLAMPGGPQLTATPSPTATPPPLEAPQWLEPSNVDTIIDQKDITVAFRWAAVAGAERYRIRESFCTLTCIVVERTIQTGTEYILAVGGSGLNDWNPSPGGIYAITVRALRGDSALNSLEQGPQSTARTVIYQPTTPTPTPATSMSAPRWIEPDRDYTVVDADDPGVLFRWEPAPGAMGYRFIWSICEPATVDNDCPRNTESADIVLGTEYLYTPTTNPQGFGGLPADDSQMRVFFVEPFGSSIENRGPRSDPRYVIYQREGVATPTPRALDPTIPPRPSDTPTPPPAPTEDPTSSISDSDLLLLLGLDVTSLPFELAWPPEPVNYVNIRAYVTEPDLLGPGITYVMRLECDLAAGDNVQWAVYGLPGASPATCNTEIQLSFSEGRFYWDMQVLLDHINSPVTKDFRLVAAPLNAVAPIVPPSELVLSFDFPVSASGMLSFPQGMRDTGITLLLPTRDPLPAPALFEVTVACAGQTEPLRWNILNTIAIHQPPGFDIGPHLCGETIPFAYSAPDVRPAIDLWYDWPPMQSSANFTVMVRPIRTSAAPTSTAIPTRSTFTPTPRPTEPPVASPTFTPTPRPTEPPAPSPTFTPTPRPTEPPVASPTFTPTPRPTDIPVAPIDRDYALNLRAGESTRFSEAISYPNGDTSDRIFITIEGIRGEQRYILALSCGGMGTEAVRWQVPRVTQVLTCGGSAAISFTADRNQQTVMIELPPGSNPAYVTYTLSLTAQ